MIVTEKEAAEKWCPHVRYANSKDTLWSNRGESNGFNGCIGSHCMAWRRGDGNCDVWKKPDGSFHHGHTVGAHAVGKQGEVADGWLTVGFCGLAGKP